MCGREVWGGGGWEGGMEKEERRERLRVREVRERGSERERERDGDIERARVRGKEGGRRQAELSLINRRKL